MVRSSFNNTTSAITPIKVVCQEGKHESARSGLSGAQRSTNYGSHLVQGKRQASNFSPMNSSGIIANSPQLKLNLRTDPFSNLRKAVGEDTKSEHIAVAPLSNNLAMKNNPKKMFE